MPLVQQQDPQDQPELVAVKRQLLVVGTYSATARQELWKVLSRRLADPQTAEEWLSFCAAEPENRRRRVFVIELDTGQLPAAGQFRVLRSHSHTDRQQLVRVMGPAPDLASARRERDRLQAKEQRDRKDRRHDYLVARVAD